MLDDFEKQIVASTAEEEFAKVKGKCAESRAMVIVAGRQYAEELRAALAIFDHDPERRNRACDEIENMGQKVADEMHPVKQ